MYRLLNPDDAFIAYRYAHNLLSGRGWVYNPGEAVNGATSPLHVLLIALFGALLHNVPAAAHLIEAAALAASAWLSYLLFRRSGRPEAGVAAGMLLITSPFLLATFGMETMLYLGLAMMALYYYHTDRMIWFGIAIGLLLLARPDGILLAAILLLHRWVTSKRLPLLPLGIAAAICLPWLAFSTAAFGSPLPSTFGAKMAQGASRHLSAFGSGAWSLATSYVKQNPWSALLIPASVAGLYASARRARSYLIIPVWGACYFAAYALLGVPAYHWYYGPVVLALLFLAAAWLLLLDDQRAIAVAAASYLALLVLALVSASLITHLRPELLPGAEWQPLKTSVEPTRKAVLIPLVIGLALAGLSLRLRSRPPIARWALAAAVFLPVLITQSYMASVLSRAFPEPRALAYRKVAAWLRHNSSPGSTVTAMEIGTIGYYSDRRMFDYLGLITPAARSHVARGDFAWWLRACPPDYVIVRRPPADFERPALLQPGFRTRYHAAAEVRTPGYPPLVIYRRIAAAAPPAPAPPRREPPPRPLAFGPGRPSLRRLASAARSANLVICVLDAARADRVGCYGYPRETTPNTDRLARESVVFREHFAVSSSTKPSTASLFTGLYPDTHRFSERGALGAGTFTLATGLRAAGWRTALFSSNVNASPELGLGTGFAEAFPDRSGARASEGLDWGTPEVLTRTFADWLTRARPRRFFAYLHFLPPHAPYRAPEALEKLVTKRRVRAAPKQRYEFPEAAPTDIRPQRYSPDQWADLYDANLRWADWGVGEVVRALRQRGLLDNTLLIITSDHGEAFGEHGYVYHMHGVYDELVHIPLLIRFPGRTRLLGDVSALTQTVDLLPTICDLYDVSSSPRVQGKSLLPLLDGGAKSVRDRIFAVSDEEWPSYLVRDSHWSLILYRGGKLRALYDLRRDPAQKRNLIAGDPQTAARLIAAFTAFARTQERPLAEFVSPRAAAAPAPAPPRPKLSDQARKELQALGYLQ